MIIAINYYRASRKQSKQHNSAGCIHLRVEELRPALEGTLNDLHPLGSKCQSHLPEYTAQIGRDHG